MAEPSGTTSDYGEAIRAACHHLLSTREEVIFLGQGLWSPWYVGNSMRDLDREFGAERIIDSPVSESATTGAAIGASLCGQRAVVVHPRVDFMILAVDQIVTQAAKWSHMFGGQASPAVTIRGIVNRGGEQGAQHSQALHAWFAHVPGLRVVMPASVEDARDLLVASVLCDDPVVYIDDRWLYDQRAELGPVRELDLAGEGPLVRRAGGDLTIVGASWGTRLALEAAELLEAEDIDAEVIDLRVINPLDARPVLRSVEKTGRLLVVDSGWSSCGLAGEVIARVAEGLPPGALRSPPARVTTADTPAPTSRPLEKAFYPDAPKVAERARAVVAGAGRAASSPGRAAELPAVARGGERGRSP